MHDILLNICSNMAHAAGECGRTAAATPECNGGQGGSAKLFCRHDVNASQQLI